MRVQTALLGLLRWAFKSPLTLGFALAIAAILGSGAVDVARGTMTPADLVIFLIWLG